LKEKVVKEARSEEECLCNLVLVLLQRRGREAIIVELTPTKTPSSVNEENLLLSIPKKRFAICMHL